MSNMFSTRYLSILVFSCVLLCSSTLFAAAPARQNPAPKTDKDPTVVIKELEERLEKAQQSIDELEKLIRIAARAQKVLNELPAVQAAENLPQVQVNDSPEMDLIRAESLSKVFREASKKVIPATVKIHTQRRRPSNIGIGESVIPRDLPGMPSVPGESMGTGVLINPRGIVLTNNHVIEGARTVEVELSDGRKFKVIDSRTDPRTDIAMLRLDTNETLPYANFGNSDQLDIGDWVLAIGNPFELDSTVSAGIISAKGRSLKKIERGDFLQTDASINPGNSGGPLVNLKGEIVGINTAIASASGGNQGIGFAIPSNTAKWVITQLASTGTVVRAYLGVLTVPVSADLGKELGIPPRRGVVVERVFENTPGEKGGIRRNDVILAFNDQPVNTPEELMRAVEQADITKSHTLSVVREKKTGKITLNLERMPDDFTEQDRFFVKNPEKYSDGRLGLLLVELTEGLASRFQVKAKSGLIVLSVIPGSLADRFEMKVGMLIEKVDGIPIETVEDYKKAMRRGPLSQGFEFQILSPEGREVFTIQSL